MNFKIFLKNLAIVAVLTAFSLAQALVCPKDGQQLIKFGPHADIESELVPANFRTMQDINKLKFNGQSDKLIKGLEKVNASASAQFYAEVIPTMIATLRQKGAHDITIIDLREESHVFINGVPYFWYLKPDNHFDYAQYNIGKTAEQIEEDEAAKIAELKIKKTANVFGLRETAGEIKGWPDLTDCADQDNFEIETIMTEKELVQKHGLHYLRLPITDDHAPTPQIIDIFIAHFKTHPNTWYHAHCEAGRGRTTTALVMIDMLYNAKDVDFDTIIERQALLGGLLLSKISEDRNPLIKKASQERMDTLKSFYQYCKENADDYATAYSMWLKNKEEKK